MSEQIKWTAEAEAKVKDIPFFVRPFARKKIENYAYEKDIFLITVEVYEEAKMLFNKKHN